MDDINQCEHKFPIFEIPAFYHNEPVKMDFGFLRSHPLEIGFNFRCAENDFVKLSYMSKIQIPPPLIFLNWLNKPPSPNPCHV